MAKLNLPNFNIEVPEKTELVPCTFYADRELAEKIEKLANEYNISKSRLLGEVVRKALCDA